VMTDASAGRVMGMSKTPKWRDKALDLGSKTQEKRVTFRLPKDLHRRVKVVLKFYGIRMTDLLLASLDTQLQIEEEHFQNFGWNTEEGDGE